MSIAPTPAPTPAASRVAARVAAQRRRVLWALSFLPALAAAGLSLGAGSVLAASLNGSGRAATETRTPGEFQAVSTRGSIDLVVRQGPAIQVQVQADDNLLPHLETVVEDGALIVRWQRGHSIRTRSPVRVEVVMPRLTALGSAGSGDLRLEAFKTPSLKIALSGSGDAHLASLTTDELRVSISGSSDVTGAGQAGRADISVSGSGNVRLLDLAAEDVSVRIAGSGDVAVHAQKKLTISIAGSGDVSYKGEPALTSTVAGSGSVRKR